MMSRWRYYGWLGVLDLLRLWSTTQHHVIIVAGICLPILLLLGLKRGHVAELRKDLVGSPSGRQVEFFSALKGEFLTSPDVERLKQELPGVAVIIPDTSRVVTLRATGADGQPREVEGATLFSTRPGDPILLQAGATLPQPGERGVVLAMATAKALDVKAGDPVKLVVYRKLGGTEETAEVELKVLSIITPAERDARTGWVDVSLIDRIEQYVHGHRVAEHDWPAAGLPPRLGYGSYLVFCQAGQGLGADDIALLCERGYKVEERTQELPAALAALLKPDWKEKLQVYEVWSGQSRTRRREAMDVPTSELEDVTRNPGDVFIGWNEPLTADVGGQTWSLLGLSLPRRTWLRQHFLSPDLPMPPGVPEDPLVVRLTGEPCESLAWPLHRGSVVKLKTNAGTVKPIVTTASPVAVVPAVLASWLASERAGVADYDPATQRFTDPVRPPLYDKARLYADTIDDVPGVVEALQQRNYAVKSERGRITEIHQQDRALQLLVVVVGAGVFLFGVVTVVSVLLDSTDRKRGTIGILRVMGMSRGGVFASIFIRATAISLLAAGLTVGLGYLLAWGLSWPPPEGHWLAPYKPVVSVHLHLTDSLLVLIGALVCCLFGAVWPAWRASRLDPFDAIVEGRFR